MYCEVSSRHRSSQLFLATQIRDLADLRGKAVVTIEPYVNRLYKNHQIVATDKEGVFLLH
jgi:hypothetical protein